MCTYLKNIAVRYILTTNMVKNNICNHTVPVDPTCNTIVHYFLLWRVINIKTAHGARDPDWLSRTVLPVPGSRQGMMYFVCMVKYGIDIL